MAETKTKRYEYILVVRCKNCETISEEIGPCVKCKKLVFVREYVVKVVK